MADLLKDAQSIRGEKGVEKNSANRIGGWMEAAAGEIAGTKSDITKLKVDKADKTALESTNTKVYKLEGEVFDNISDQFDGVWETVNQKADTAKPSGEKVVYSAETAPQDGDMLIREGGKWVNKPLWLLEMKQQYTVGNFLMPLEATGDGTGVAAILMYMYDVTQAIISGDG